MGLSNEYIINILKKKVENEMTRNTYITKLNTLTLKFTKSIYDILKDPSIYYSKIKELYPSSATQKNFVTMILAIFKVVDELNIKKRKAHQAWKDIHEKLREQENIHYKKNQPSNKQLENYLSFNEIQEKYDALKKSQHQHATKKDSLEYLLLSISLYLRPKRADYGNISIIYPNMKTSPSKNYIYINGKHESYLILKEYKTSKTYEKIKEKIPEPLYEDIIESLKHHPRIYLFTDRNSQPYLKKGSYSTYVLRAYEHLFNKKVGVTMLRHIYIREKLDFNGMTQEELEKEAILMGHSPEVQRRYRWVLRENEQEKCECRVVI